MITGIIIAGVVILVIVAVVIEAYLKRNRHNTLSSSRPISPQDNSKPKLGMEATDTELVDAAHRQNKQIQRLHDQLTKRRR